MDSENQFLIYQTDSGSIEVQLAQDSVWLTQAQMVELLGKTKQNISLHIRNICKEGELVETSVVKDSLTTAADGKRYRTRHYNLDVVISVGYRVKSLQGTRFRIWANKVLKEYLIQGYALDQQRLQRKSIGSYSIEIEAHWLGLLADLKSDNNRFLVAA